MTTPSQAIEEIRSIIAEGATLDGPLRIEQAYHQCQQTVVYRYIAAHRDAYLGAFDKSLLNEASYKVCDWWFTWDAPPIGEWRRMDLPLLVGS